MASCWNAEQARRKVRRDAGRWSEAGKAAVLTLLDQPLAREAKRRGAA